MARRKRQLSRIYVVSIGAHVAIGVALALIPQERLREVVSIVLQEAPKHEKQKPKPRKPPPKPEHRAPEHHRARAHRSARSPAPASTNAAPAFTNLGLTLDSSSADGLAVNIAAPAAPAPAPKPVAQKVIKPKVLVARRSEPKCGEPLIKPRPLGIVRPSYTAEARRARIEGRLRIELEVDKHGTVTSAHVLDGLGYGLDEAALASARQLRFAAATQCGRPVATSFVIAMRFLLGS